MNLEVVWHGALHLTWTPTPAPPLSSRHVQPGASDYKARLRAVLTENWQTVNALHQRSQMDRNRAQQYLERMVADGSVERRTGPNQQGKVFVQYRHRPVTQEPRA